MNYKKWKIYKRRLKTHSNHRPLIREKNRGDKAQKVSRLPTIFYGIAKPIETNVLRWWPDWRGGRDYPETSRKWCSVYAILCRIS